MSPEIDFNKQLLAIIQKIQNAIDFSDIEMAELMDIPLSNLNKIKSLKQEISIHQIDLIAKELRLSSQNIINGTIDYKCLSLSYDSVYSSPPERYSSSEQKISTMRGIDTVIHFLNSYLGEAYTDQIFKRFQINPHIFKLTQNDKVSSLLPFDILQSLKKEGFSDEHFRMIGQSTLEVNKQDLGKELVRKRGAKELYSSVMEEVMPHYDQLCHYEIFNITHTGCTIKVRPNNEMKDFFEHLPLSRELSLYKQGAFMSLLGNIRNSFARVEEHKCLFQGDSYCCFSLHWEKEQSIKQRLPAH